MLLHTREVLSAADERSRITISNALVESALVNARGLVWFLCTGAGDVNVEMYGLPRDDDVGKLRDVIVRAISQHVSHVTKARRKANLAPARGRYASWLMSSSVASLSPFETSNRATRSRRRGSCRRRSRRTTSC